MRYIKSIFAAAATILAAAVVYAQPRTGLRPDETVLLYAESFDGNTDIVYAEKVSYAGYCMKEKNDLTGLEKITNGGSISNISDLARIDLYHPETPNGQMIIVCPGGGYSNVSSYNEGLYTASWMMDRGITVAVVKYRLPNGHREIPHADVENAFRYCRAHASEWGVDQIGIIGFSAGGHLAATTSALHSSKEFADYLNVDCHKIRINGCILGYPVISKEVGHLYSFMNFSNGDESLQERFSVEKMIDENYPKTFIWHTTFDSAVNVKNSLYLANSLSK